MVIATSVPTHATLAVRALEAGKHVFVEKPLARDRRRRTTGHATSATERGLIAMVDHLLVYHPGLQRVKDLIDEGALGDRTFYMYGNRQNLGIVRPDENALWSLGPHDISVMIWLAGERPSEVAAWGTSYLQPGVEDVVFGHVRFPSGVTGHLHLSWLDPHKMRKMTVIGSERMVVFDDMETERKVTIYDKGPITHTATYGEYIQVRSGDIHIPKIDGTEPLRRVCEHFVDCVANGTRPMSDAVAGLAVVEVLEAMTQSMHDAGRPGHHRRNQMSRENLVAGRGCRVGRGRRDRRQRGDPRGHRHRRRLRHPGQRGHRQAAAPGQEVHRQARAARAAAGGRRHRDLRRVRAVRRIGDRQATA